MISLRFQQDRRHESTIEYQPMPSLRDLALDGGLCTFRLDRGKWCGPSGQAAWTVYLVQNQTLLGHSPPANQAVLDQPSSLFLPSLVPTFFIIFDFVPRQTAPSFRVVLTLLYMYSTRIFARFFFPDSKSCF
jgi:hypothetical protein